MSAILMKMAILVKENVICADDFYDFLHGGVWPLLGHSKETHKYTERIYNPSCKPQDFLFLYNLRTLPLSVLLNTSKSSEARTPSSIRFSTK